MQKTVKKRTRLIQTSGFEEAIKQYPKVLCPGMIEQDFQLRFPKAADKLYQKWPTLHQTVTVFAEKNFPGWRQQLPWDCSFLDDEEIAFLALPLVFQSRHKTKKGKGSSSITSCVKSFIDIQPNLTSIDLYCEEIDAKARPQPFIVILWDLLQRTRQFFVLFERRPLPSPSLLKAIDTCFKLHYVFDLDYQADCVASWQFLQNIIFEMNSTASTEINTVKAFRAYYNSL
ncbi:hypothetical protein HOLleu_39074 [Holothuria leucospilota]|uniref:Uncharacterized protein n=1 Tax=Holothuria leucospilota TaxID=206669 RepID=A0A9Q0YI46_HOLLE|nr:hypothetical protein HOLleu_39074 [Holothuria leucospilota]